MRLSLGLSGERIAARVEGDFADIGLIRGEYVFRRCRSYITTDTGRAALAAYLEAVCTLYPDRPVWYRTSELDVEEVKVLDGCDDDSLNDRILCMGTRGIRRAMILPAAFETELATVADASRRHPRLGLIFPFVADPSEAAWAARKAREAGFRGSLCAMLEIPAAVMTLDVILDLGYRRALFGVNDGTAFTMGAYRGSERYPGLPLGVARMIEHAKRLAAPAGAELSIAGKLTESHLAQADAMGVDTCVVHYADLPQLLGPRYAALPELDTVLEIKRWTRAAIKHRRQSQGVVPLDPYGN